MKSVRPCEPAVANKHSGYFIGGTSPFGTRRRMPVYAESTIFDLDDIHINAGHRGLMLKMKAADIEKAARRNPGGGGGRGGRMRDEG